VRVLYLIYVAGAVETKFSSVAIKVWKGYSTSLKVRNDLGSDVL